MHAPPDATPTLPEMLKAVRRRLKVTQEQFAAKVGCNLRTYQQWECGRCAPTGKNLAAIHAVLFAEVPVVKVERYGTWEFEEMTMEERTARFEKMLAEIAAQDAEAARFLSWFRPTERHVNKERKRHVMRRRVNFLKSAQESLQKARAHNEKWYCELLAQEQALEEKAKLLEEKTRQLAKAQARLRAREKELQSARLALPVQKG